jgi:carboxypeptidase family protein
MATGVAQSQTPKLAQSAKANPVMRGTVQDTLGQGLEGAQIEILGLKLVATTPGSGSYRFDDIKPGRYWVAVRRIGYAPLRAALTFNPGDDREIVFQLEPLAHMLPEVVVQGEDKRWMRRYQDFVWRSRSSFGHFLTRDDIEKAHPAYLGDIVHRYLPFTTSDVFFRSSFDDGLNRGSFSALGHFGSSRGNRLGHNCAPAVSVNGARPMGGWAVNDFRPEDVEALEVYRNGYQMPMEFLGWDLPCGLVIVWT